MGRNILVGTAGNDVLDGREGSDIYLVGPNRGIDTFSDSGAATCGTDRIIATAGNFGIGIASGFGPESGIEKITAANHDGVSIEGGTSADVFDFSETTLIRITRIAGGFGNDQITGSDGTDRLCGENQSDTLKGGPGDDELFGGAANDAIPALNVQHGHDGNDFLDGGQGRDKVAGGAGDDTLLGGPGADVLYGSSGEDWLTGGGGRDRFVYRDSGEGGDHVTDFVQGDDVLDLSDIDANLAVAGDQAFLIGGKSNDAVPNSVTVWRDGDTTIVQADTSGDNVPELTIELVGAVQLRVGDFVL